MPLGKNGLWCYEVVGLNYLELGLDQGENAGGRSKMRAYILVLLLAFLISAANGLEVSVSQSNGASGASISMNYGALKDNFVDQDIKVSPVSGEMGNHVYFSGPGSRYAYAYGKYGGYATSGFSIRGSKAYTSYDFSLSSNPYASVSGGLNSQNALEINAYAYASDNKGDQAYGKINVYSPSNNAYLGGYSNNAYATSTYAQVIQSASYASANSPYGTIVTDLWSANSRTTGIKTSMTPYNVKDFSEVYTKQSYYPVLSSYPYYWTAKAYADSSNTYAKQGFYGYGSPIYTNEYAKKYGWGALSRTQYNYGWHALGQYAYTTTTGQGVQYPHLV
jgi:hypothetical protein